MFTLLTYPTNIWYLSHTSLIVLCTKWLWFFSSLTLILNFIPCYTLENEKNIVERNVSTSGVSIYFEAYLYNATNCTSTPWHLPPMHMSSSQRRPSTAVEEEDEDSPSECHTPEKVKKPKKVYCYVSPKVRTPILVLRSTCLSLHVIGIW